METSAEALVPIAAAPSCSGCGRPATCLLSGTDGDRVFTGDPACETCADHCEDAASHLDPTFRRVALAVRDESHPDQSDLNLSDYMEKNSEALLPEGPVAELPAPEFPPQITITVNGDRHFNLLLPSGQVLVMEQASTVERSIVGLLENLRAVTP